MDVGLLIYCFKLIVLFSFVLFSGSVLCAALFSIRAEKTLPVTSTAIMILLFIFYCLDMLALGRIIIIALISSCYIASFISIGVNVKNKNYSLRQTLSHTAKNIFTPGSCIFILGLILIFHFTVGGGPTQFDELRLWGVYPRILYFTGDLQLRPDRMLVFRGMNNYLPGMPLFQYFFLKFMRIYREDMTLFSYGAFCLSLFMPVTKHITWKQPWMIFPVSMAVVFLPLTVFRDLEGGIYRSLFIDAALGLMAGYLFYLAMGTPFKNMFSVIQFGLGLITVSLIKTLGILFAGTAFMTAFVLELVCFDGFKGKCRKRTALFCSAAFICVFFTHIAWTVMGKIYGLTRVFSFARPFSFNYIGELIQTIENTKFYSFILAPVSIGTIFRVLIICAIVLYFALPRSERRIYFIAVCGLAASNIGELCGLYILGVMNWSGNFYSFQRYFGSAILADFFFFFCFILRLFLTQRAVFTKPQVKIMVSILVCALIFQTNSFINAFYTVPFSQFIAESDIASLKISSSLPPLPDNDYHKAPGVLVIFPDESSTENLYYYFGVQHRIYYDSIGTNYFSISFTNAAFLSEWRPRLLEGDTVERGEEIQSWLRDAATQGADYIWFYSLNGEVGGILRAYFAERGIRINEQVTYRLAGDERGYKLEEIDL